MDVIIPAGISMGKRVLEMVSVSMRNPAPRMVEWMMSSLACLAPMSLTMCGMRRPMKPIIPETPTHREEERDVKRRVRKMTREGLMPTDKEKSSPTYRASIALARSKRTAVHKTPPHRENIAPSRFVPERCPERKRRVEENFSGMKAVMRKRMKAPQKAFTATPPRITF